MDLLYISVFWVLLILVIMIIMEYRSQKLYENAQVQVMSKRMVTQGTFARDLCAKLNIDETEFRQAVMEAWESADKNVRYYWYG